MKKQKETKIIFENKDNFSKQGMTKMLCSFYFGTTDMKKIVGMLNKANAETEKED